MQNNLDRAKQFLPFDALKGFRKALEEKEKNYENKKDLSDDYFHNLDIKIKNIKKDMNVRIKYYHDLEYIETTGVIRKIDNLSRYIVLLNSKISFDDILDIEMF